MQRLAERSVVRLGDAGSSLRFDGGIIWERPSNVEGQVGWNLLTGELEGGMISDKERGWRE